MYIGTPSRTLLPLAEASLGLSSDIGINNTLLATCCQLVLWPRLREICDVPVIVNVLVAVNIVGSRIVTGEHIAYGGSQVIFSSPC